MKAGVEKSSIPEVEWSEGRMPSTTNFEGGEATGEVWQGATMNESLFTTNLLGLCSNKVAGEVCTLKPNTDQRAKSLLTTNLVGDRRSPDKFDHVKIAGGFIAIDEDVLDEDKVDAPVTISEKSEQKNMKMETYMNRRIDEYIVGFKNDIKSKMSTLEIINQSNSSETELEKMREFLEFIFEYPKLILDKKDFIVSKRRASSSITPDQENQVSVLTFPAHMQCLAKRSDGIQCTRKKKKCCDFCGTHAKLDAIQRTSTTESIQRMEVSAEDIHGIIYYIDRYNNVYNTEDILEGRENPRIIAKATKHSNNMYMIEEFL